MKDLFTNLALFIVFCIVFSGLTSCEETKSNVAGNNVKQNSANGSPAKPPGENTGSTSNSPAYPPLRTGLAEAEFELLDGVKMKISEKKGKVLLLNIWGIWCGPCREEMPHLVELQNKYRDQGFEVIGLNIGDHDGAPESVDAIKKFADSMKLNYTLARSAAASTRHFYMITKQQVVPQTIIVDREGKLRGVFVGGGPRVIGEMKLNVEKTMADQPA